MPHHNLPLSTPLQPILCPMSSMTQPLTTDMSYTHEMQDQQPCTNTGRLSASMVPHLLHNMYSSYATVPQRSTALYCRQSRQLKRA